MKRMLSLLLCAILVLSLCACGSTVKVTGSGDGEEAAEVVITELKTMGDALKASESGPTMASWDEAHYVYCLEFNGVPTRVAADLDEELYAQVDKIVFSGDPDAEEQLADLLSPLPLTSVEDLSSGLLSDEELSALAGKTGKDLLDDGWIISGSYWSDDDALVVLMDKGLFCYEITFDHSVETGDDFDVEAAIQDMTVVSAVYFSFGDASTELEVTP